MLLEFVENNDLESVKTALASGVDIWADKFGYSALHMALSKGFDEIAKLLISGGIDVNLQDQKGQTALHYCAFYNKVDLAELILRNRGDLDIEDVYGNQSLWTAVFNDYGRSERIELVELFLSHGAQKDHKNKAKRSPLDIVTSRPYENLFTLFGLK